MKTYSYLALGDSYTIGEQVPLYESFPYQTLALLRKADINKNDLQHNFAAPEILAKTGWTTDELSAAIRRTAFLPQYDFVSLLIGVNNQYRGRSSREFKTEFDLLLQMAIQFADGNASHVFVLSIPDWGVTPFAKDRDAEKIAKEIDEFNAVCKQSAESAQCHYIDITESQRSDGNDPAFLAADELHPSGNEYKKWAEKLSVAVLKTLEG